MTKKIPIPQEMLFTCTIRVVRVYAALLLLATFEKWTLVTLAEIAEVSNMRTSDISQQMKTLEYLGYIKRRTASTATQSYVKEVYLEKV